MVKIQRHKTTDIHFLTTRELRKRIENASITMLGKIDKSKMITFCIEKTLEEMGL